MWYLSIAVRRSDDLLQKWLFKQKRLYIPDPSISQRFFRVPIVRWSYQISALVVEKPQWLYTNPLSQNRAKKPA